MPVCRHAPFVDFPYGFYRILPSSCRRIPSQRSITRMLVTSDWRFPRGFAVPQSINKKLGSETIFQGQKKGWSSTPSLTGVDLTLSYQLFWLVLRNVVDTSAVGFVDSLLASLFSFKLCAKIVRITRKCLKSQEAAKTRCRLVG